jgi:hypothetical protein
MGHATSMTPWGKYPNYRDIARLEYGRLLWKKPEARRRLLAHWETPDHPHAERFQENISLFREILESPLGSRARLLPMQPRPQPPRRSPRNSPGFRIDLITFRRHSSSAFERPNRHRISPQSCLKATLNLNPLAHSRKSSKAQKPPVNLP